MLARVLLGAIGGYFALLLAYAIASAGDIGGFWRLKQMLALSDAEFVPETLVPILVGAAAGYCWHMLSSEKKHSDRISRVAKLALFPHEHYVQITTNVELLNGAKDEAVCGLSAGLDRGAGQVWTRP